MTYRDIREVIFGAGRILKLRNGQILKLIQGNFKNGKKHGYCLEMDLESRYCRIAKFYLDKLEDRNDYFLFHFGDVNDPKIKYMSSFDKCKFDGMIDEE